MSSMLVLLVGAALASEAPAERVPDWAVGLESLSRAELEPPFKRHGTLRNAGIGLVVGSAVVTLGLGLSLVEDSCASSDGWICLDFRFEHGVLGGAVLTSPLWITGTVLWAVHGPRRRAYGRRLAALPVEVAVSPMWTPEQTGLVATGRF